MWVQVLARCSRMTHSKKVKNKVSNRRMKATKVARIEQMKKEKSRSKQSPTPIGQISASR